MPESLEQTTLAELTAEIVSAYVSTTRSLRSTWVPSSVPWPANFARSAPQSSSLRNRSPRQRCPYAVPSVRTTSSAWSVARSKSFSSDTSQWSTISRLTNIVRPSGSRAITRWRRRATQRSGVSSPCNSAWGGPRSRGVNVGRNRSPNPRQPRSDSSLGRAPSPCPNAGRHFTAVARFRGESGWVLGCGSCEHRASDQAESPCELRGSLASVVALGKRSDKCCHSFPMAWVRNVQEITGEF